MSGVNPSPIYRWAKGIWLLMQGLLLPLAALYLVRDSRLNIDSEILRILLGLAGAFFLILWIIAHALLTMARYPLETAGALQLTLGHLFTFLVTWLLVGLPLFAACTTFLTTLTALIICGFLLGPAAVKAGLTGWSKVIYTDLVLLVGVLGIVWLGLPLWGVITDLTWWEAGFNLLVIAGSVTSTVRSLWRTTILSENEQADRRAYDAEWQRWAAPTIITLILSATAAVMIVGIGQAR